MDLIGFNSFTARSLCLFAVAEPKFPEGLEYYRYPIVILSFTARGGADMYCTRLTIPLVMDVYEDFAPGSSKKDQGCCGATAEAF